jgi:hypothetical protein
MVKRIAPVAVVWFVLMAVCGVVGQNARPSLPDSPSVQAAEQGEARTYGFLEASRTPLRFGAGSSYAEAIRVIRQGEFAAADRAISSQRASENIFSKYLRRPTAGLQSSYSSSNESLTGRATHAAAGIFVTRDGTGKGRLNIPYFLRALTSVAADTASRPYWRRSVAEPFSDFGSTVGNDAGMNLWREFAPSIEQMLKSHAPKFVMKIKGRIGQH